MYTHTQLSLSTHTYIRTYIHAFVQPSGGAPKHCNSCLLIISASISRSKPPANADRTLSLSRPLHFAPLSASPILPFHPLSPLS